MRSEIEKGIYWADTTQDIVDNFLEKQNYIWRNKYTYGELKKFYKEVLKNETLRKEFNTCYKKTFERDSNKEEFIYHILVGLLLENPMMRLKFLHDFSDDYEEHREHLRKNKDLATYVIGATTNMERRQAQFECSIMVDKRKMLPEGEEDEHGERDAKINKEIYKNFSAKDAILTGVPFSKHMGYMYLVQ